MKVSGRGPQAKSAYSGSASAQGVGLVSPRPGYTLEGERTAASIQESYDAWSDQQPTMTVCLFCGWAHQGSALEGRDVARAHREKNHPEACIRKPRLRKRITKKKLRTAGEEEQIKVDAAEARRIRHEREQDEMLAKIEKGRARDRAAQAALDVA